jgi:hypothetical protein
VSDALARVRQLRAESLAEAHAHAQAEAAQQEQRRQQAERERPRLELAVDHAEKARVMAAWTPAQRQTRARWDPVAPWVPRLVRRHVAPIRPRVRSGRTVRPRAAARAAGCRSGQDPGQPEEPPPAHRGPA